MYDLLTEEINWTGLLGDDYKYNVTICDLGSLCNTTSIRSITLITSQSNITLSSGWNLISLPMKNTDTGTDRNISLVAGWNLIGYNGGVNTSLSNAKFNNGSNSYTWAQALANNKVQAYLAYYDNNAQDNLTQYKYLSTLRGLDDTAFRQNKGYWIYANEAGNLTIPEVGGSLSGQTYAWNKLRFANANGTELNVSDAGTAGAGWFITSGIKYWGLIRYDEEGVPMYGWITVKSTDNFNPWLGYFIYSNKDNISLIRQN